MRDLLFFWQQLSEVPALVRWGIMLLAGILFLLVGKFWFIDRTQAELKEAREVEQLLLMQIEEQLLEYARLKKLEEFFVDLQEPMTPSVPDGVDGVSVSRFLKEVTALIEHSGLQVDHFQPLWSEGLQAVGLPPVALRLRGEFNPLLSFLRGMITHYQPILVERITIQSIARTVDEDISGQEEDGSLLHLDVMLVIFDGAYQ